MKLDLEQIRALGALLRDADLTELEIEEADWKLRMSRHVPVVASLPGAGVAPVRAEATPAVPEVEPAEIEGAVRSPMVGIVYLAPDPQAEPFVREGDRLQSGQTLLIIEAMKVLNPIPAPAAGTLVRLAVDNGQAVEFGQLLAVIES